MDIINCYNLSIGYEKKVIISDINLTINDGDYVCVFGENGSGKSTLLKTILGLNEPLKGKISFNDSFNRKLVGYLPQKASIKSDFPASVYEIVLSGCLNRLGFRPFYSKNEKEIVDRNMRLLGVKHLSKRPFKDLSGGQQQRVLLSRALCATDKLLVLDEPFTGLDQATTDLLYQVLEKINKELGVTIIIVSHYIEDILSYAEKVIYLNEKSCFFGTTKEYIIERKNQLSNLDKHIEKQGGNNG